MERRSNRRKKKKKAENTTSAIVLNFYFSRIPTVAKQDRNVKFQGKRSYGSRSFSVFGLRHQGEKVYVEQGMHETSAARNVKVLK